MRRPTIVTLKWHGCLQPVVPKFKNVAAACVTHLFFWPLFCVYALIILDFDIKKCYKSWISCNYLYRGCIFSQVFLLLTNCICFHLLAVSVCMLCYQHALLSSDFIHFVEYIDGYWCLLKNPGVRCPHLKLWKSHTGIQLRLFLSTKELKMRELTVKIDASAMSFWNEVLACRQAWVLIDCGPSHWNNHGRLGVKKGRDFRIISHQHWQGGTTRKRICSI